MRLFFSIFLILSVHAEKLSTFIDDYYNGMNDYEIDYERGVKDWITHWMADLDRLTNLMTQGGNYNVRVHIRF